MYVCTYVLCMLAHTYVCVHVSIASTYIRLHACTYVPI